MDLAEVMDQIAERADAIEGLRVHPSPAPGADVQPPALIVSYPEDITFDETYGRGMDRMTLPLVLVVGQPAERQTRDQLAKYCNGSGANSLKQVLESGEYTAFDTLRVVDIDFDTVSIGGIDHVAALFTLDIAGPGSS